ncbi:transposase [Agrobacterium rhizogenes]|uniref:IS66-like element accessory protein TnpA n=1 Tax=Rhizobium rhizogenes TaxID=359 RepID=UPI0015734F50|nr:transposase [Rhizobium rhizogenes]NTH14222.1 transposase [Rhizobium rhizogenes]NTI78218.1 transposase [Rhizobium rhizogenes]
MVGDRADAMLEVMDEARPEGNYRRIEVITGRRQRRNWTGDEKARILAESAEPDANISAVARRWGVNRGLLNVWRRDAGLTFQRTGNGSASQAMFVPVAMVGDQISAERSPACVAEAAGGRIEIEFAGARMTVIGSVAPELAQAMVTALRGRR